MAVRHCDATPSGGSVLESDDTVGHVADAGTYRSTSPGGKNDLQLTSVRESHDVYNAFKLRIPL